MQKATVGPFSLLLFVFVWEESIYQEHNLKKKKEKRNRNRNWKVRHEGWKEKPDELLGERYKDLGNSASVPSENLRFITPLLGHH